MQDKSGLESVNISSTGLDKAAVYLHNHGQSEEGSVDTRSLLRKIDWTILPLAFFCYAVQFIDKININVCVLAPALRGTVQPKTFHISMQLSWE